MKILLVLLKVCSELVNFAAKYGNLNIGRAGVLVVLGRILDNGCLYAFRKH